MCTATEAPSVLPARSDFAWRVAIALVLIVAACGGDGAGTSQSDAPTTSAPSVVAAGSGAELYEATCAECHGTDLRGNDKGPSFLSSVYEPNHHTDESFRRAVRLGARQHHWPYGDMEPVEGLSDDDIEAIITFVREQQAILGFED